MEIFDESGAWSVFLLKLPWQYSNRRPGSPGRPDEIRVSFGDKFRGWRSFLKDFGDEPNPPDADDKKFFVGVWRGRFEPVGRSCSAEIIFQPNGNYSSLSQSDSGFYAFRAVGTRREGNLTYKELRVISINSITAGITVPNKKSDPSTITTTNHVGNER